MNQTEALKKKQVDKRLQRACAYVSDMWFPANPKLLKRLRTAMEHGDYDQDLDALVHEIHGDYALYMFCLKELYALLRKENIEPPAFKTPLELFRYGGIERLRTILDLESSDSSAHSFDSMSEAQKRRLEDSLVSASSAQVLAEHCSVDPELGYSAALLRQLGLTLIAWNYPTVYEKALRMLQEGQNLDVALHSILGFSPQMLGMAIAHSWGLPNELYVALNAESVNQEDLDTALETEAIGSMLAKLCKIGETLARANNPVDYPSARKDWADAQVEVMQRLGGEGLALIQQAVVENCQQYTIDSPDFFRPGTILDPEAHLRNHPHVVNPLIQATSPGLRLNLQILYQMLVKNSDTGEALQHLVHVAIPAAGFSGGLVYTLEPSLNLLVPQLKIGTLRTRDIRDLPALSKGTEHDLVTRAYQIEAPLNDTVTSAGEQYRGVAGLLGFTQRIGVLFLEIPENLFKDNAEQQITNFRALAQAFNDCFRLG